MKSYTKIIESTTNFDCSGCVLSEGDRFGSLPVNLGDLDGDGVVDVAVGAHRDDVGDETADGSAYILFLTTAGGIDSARKISTGISIKA